MRLILNLKTTSVFTYNKTGITYKVISNKFIYEPVCIFRVRHDLRVKIKKFLINLMLIRNGKIKRLWDNIFMDDKSIKELIKVLEKISNRLWWIALWLALTYFGL